MKNTLIVFCLLSSIVCISLTGCKKETCRNCIRCISYDSNNQIVNEVRECNKDTTYLNNFENGFQDGAASKGWSAICFDLGIHCTCE